MDANCERESERFGLSCVRVCVCVHHSNWAAASGPPRRPPPSFHWPTQAGAQRALVGRKTTTHTLCAVRRRARCRSPFRKANAGLRDAGHSNVTPFARQPPARQRAPQWCAATCAQSRPARAAAARRCARRAPRAKPPARGDSAAAPTQNNCQDETRAPLPPAGSRALAGRMEPRRRSQSNVIFGVASHTRQRARQRARERRDIESVLFGEAPRPSSRRQVDAQPMGRAALRWLGAAHKQINKLIDLELLLAQVRARRALARVASSIRGLPSRSGAAGWSFESGHVRPTVAPLQGSLISPLGRPDPRDTMISRGRGLAPGRQAAGPPGRLPAGRQSKPRPIDTSPGSAGWMDEASGGQQLSAPIAGVGVGAPTVCQRGAGRRWCYCAHERLVPGLGEKFVNSIHWTHQSARPVRWFRGWSRFWQASGRNQTRAQRQV